MEFPIAVLGVATLFLIVALVGRGELGGPLTIKIEGNVGAIPRVLFLGASGVLYVVAFVGFLVVATREEAATPGPLAQPGTPITPVAVSPPADTAAPDIAGTSWTGIAHEGVSDLRYMVRLQLSGGATGGAGGSAGTVEYPDIGCHGELTAVGQTATEVVLQEDFSSSGGPCPAAGLVGLSPDGSRLSYRRAEGGVVIAEGVLARA